MTLPLLQPDEISLGRLHRLAYLVSHPIQYQAPLLRQIAQDPEIALKVFFCSDATLRQYHDPGFGQTVAWDTPLTEGYDYEVLPAWGGQAPPGLWRPFNHGLARHLRKGRYDALWIHGYARPFHLASMLAAKALGAKVLLRDEVNALSNPRSAAKTKLKRSFFRAQDQLCDAYLAIGTMNRDYYRSQGIDDSKIFPVPYAVDNDRFSVSDPAAKAALRNTLELEPDRPVVLFSAKLITRKRPADLLEAFLALDQAAARRPYLLFVGDGALRGELEGQADGHEAVRFLGFRNQSELPGLYDLADLVVLPSEREAWGLIVNEAMNAGCAIVVSDRVGAGPDLVETGLNGFITPVGDTAALQSALAEALADPERLAAMGRKSREIIADWGFAQDLAGLKAALAAVC